MKLSKILIAIMILIISFPIFIWLENGLAIKGSSDLIKPVIFSFSASFAYINFKRRLLLILSMIMLFIMVIFYLFWQIDLANWFGSLGFGMLVIYTLGHIPQLLKKGYVEKL